MNDLQADRLFDSMLARVEKRLGRQLLNNFNQLSKLIESVILNGGELSGDVAIMQNIQDLEKILEESYRESIIEGARFTRRDLELPEEEDEDNFNEALLLLLFWREDTARSHAQMLTNTTIDLYHRFYEEARVLGLSGGARSQFISRELLRRNRGRVRNIATSEAGEALSAGSGAQADILNEALLKSWRSQRDSVVRDSHRRADQRYNSEPIPLDDNFQVGASSGPFPRSSQLSASERNGCRCYIRHKRLKDVQK